MSSEGSSIPLPDDSALRAIVQGVEAETGERFFASLVQNLSPALGVQYAFVTRLSDDGQRFRTLAVWERGKVGNNFELPLQGTPCEGVLHGEAAHYPERLCQLFPDDKGLLDWRAESYCGVPVFDSAGKVFGHLAIIDDKPMRDGPRGVAIMRIFAARVRAEIERLRVEDQLRETGERLGRIVDSAMDAIVTFDPSGKIELFNQAAEKVFGPDATEAIGQPIERFLGAEMRRAIETSMAALVSGPITHSFLLGRGPLTAVRRGGEEFPIEATISRARVGRRNLYTLILRDMNQRRRAEEEVRHLTLQNEYLREEIKAEHNFEEIVGNSRALSAVLEQVRLVAATDSTVLILGETGTGKELIARAIHSSSARQERPLIKVNCTALPTGLVESELFGHEKGAYTGATERRIGRFELANGGTIFLDEVGEVPPEVQVKLLRVLQEREFERIGARDTIKVDLRVIAATNRDLNRAVAEGKFRQDLFYRLNVFPIVMPPLRARRDDLPLLVHYFVRRYASKIGRTITSIPAHTMGRLTSYDWPGNIRELENVIERAAILSTGPELELPAELIPAASRPWPADATGAGIAGGAALPQAGDRSLSQGEREQIVAVLRQTNGRVEGPGGAARLLGLNPSTLRSRMKKLGVERGRGEA